MRAAACAAVGGLAGYVALWAMRAGRVTSAPSPRRRLVWSRRFAVRASRGDALPIVLDTVARAVRGGASLRQALGAAASAGEPLGSELRAVERAMVEGVSLRDAMARWAALRPDPSVRLAATALVLAYEQGGDVAAAARGAAATIRASAAARAEVAAQSAQARASAVVVAATPVGFSLLLTATDPRVRHVVLATPVGWFCCLVGAALIALGSWWMRRLIEDARSWC